MIPTQASFRQSSDIDRWMSIVVVGNGLGAIAIGHLHGQGGLAIALAIVSAIPGLLGTALARGRLLARLALAFSLTALVALQIHLSGGALLYHFNVFVCLSFLLVYADWRPIVFMATLFAVHHLGFDRLLQAGWGTYCLSAPDPQQIALHIAFVVMQSTILVPMAIHQRRAGLEARELELLVDAMGSEGPIRLGGLSVIRADTPAGQRLQHVQQRMAAALAEMSDASQQVDANARQVAAGSEELMTRTEATANGLRDSAMCLEQIGIIVQHSTEAATETRLMSAQAAAMATQGNQLVADVVQSMQSIEQSSQRINDIIAVIDGIAFQTNLLALNAAIEAARAGEQGRGFAVVAAEVRALAGRSGAAAKEIKSLVGASASTVATGTQLVSQAGQTMNQLVSSVQRVGELFASVTADTSEQMAGLHSVSQSITELSQITQNNVVVAEDAGSAAAALSAQSARLGEVMNAFKLGSAGAARVLESTPPVPPTPAAAVAALAPSAGVAAPRAAPAPAVSSAVEYF